MFNWSVLKGTFNTDHYSTFYTGEGEMSGGFDNRLPVTDGGLLFYIHVENMNKTIELVNDSGGSVVKSEYEIADGHGRAAIIKDPNGNHIGLWQE